MFKIKILIVDDDQDIRLLISTYLKNAGYEDLIFAESAEESYEILGLGEKEKNTNIDLILLDIMLKNKNGIEVCRKIKSNEQYQDIPVIMITAQTETEWLKKAFEAGAHDYIKKPINKIEFLARVESSLKLSKEMYKRKLKELELIDLSKKLKKANKKLKKMASMDGLTELANRRLFDQTIKKEFKRSGRENYNISLIMADIDNFKAYNDTYGHQKGDECIISIAKVLEKCAKRPADLAARYGGEEFAVILPKTNKEGALKIAKDIKSEVKKLKIEHKNSTTADYVTLSLGINSIIPDGKIGQNKIDKFIDNADKALYKAKENGRDRIEMFEETRGDF